jgi:hypothetical protein
MHSPRWKCGVVKLDIESTQEDAIVVPKTDRLLGKALRLSRPDAKKMQLNRLSFNRRLQHKLKSQLNTSSSHQKKSPRTKSHKLSQHPDVLSADLVFAPSAKPKKRVLVINIGSSAGGYITDDISTPMTPEIQSVVPSLPLESIADLSMKESPNTSCREPETPVSAAIESKKIQESSRSSHGRSYREGSINPVTGRTPREELLSSKLISDYWPIPPQRGSKPSNNWHLRTGDETKIMYGIWDSTAKPQLKL